MKLTHEQIKTANENGVEALYINHMVLITLKTGDKIKGIIDAIAGDRMIIAAPGADLPIIIKKDAYAYIVPVVEPKEVEFSSKAAAGEALRKAVVKAELERQAEDYEREQDFARSEHAITRSEHATHKIDKPVKSEDIDLTCAQCKRVKKCNYWKDEMKYYCEECKPF
jgi:ribosomal protein L44E